MKKKIMTLLLMAVFATSVITGCGVNKSTESTVVTPETDKEEVAETEDTEELSADDPYSDLGFELTSKDITVVTGEQSYYITPIIEHLGLYDKFFTENNIKVEQVNFDAGPEIIEAMTAGSVDWGPMGTQPAVSGAANGAGISVVAAFVDQSKSGVLATLADDINEVSDLKGKKVGTKVGSSEYAFLLWALQEAGLTVDDIEVINLDQAVIATALENGEVDAAVCNINRFLSVEVADNIKFKYVTDAVGSGTALQVIAVRNEFAEAHPDVISALLQFYVWAEDFIANNHDEAVQIISDYYGLETEIPETTLTYQTYEFTPLQEFYDTTAAYLDFMYENEYITEKPKADEFIVLDYAKTIGLK